MYSYNINSLHGTYEALLKPVHWWSPYLATLMHENWYPHTWYVLGVNLFKAGQVFSLCLYPCFSIFCHYENHSSWTSWLFFTIQSFTSLLISFENSYPQNLFLSCVILSDFLFLQPGATLPQLLTIQVKILIAILHVYLHFTSVREIV